MYVSPCYVCRREGDNDDGKLNNYVWITTNQPDIKSHPISNPNPNHTTKQHGVASTQQNIVTCQINSEKFIDNVTASFSVLSECHSVMSTVILPLTAVD